MIYYFDPVFALGIVADTGPQRNACRRMSR
jgi:hypothetical protein